MSEAADKLARSRRAILDHVARRERRHDPHQQTAAGFAADEPGYEPPADDDAGWLGHVMHAVRTWWRYHPAHMAFELAEPVMQGYARRKPAQLLGVSLLAGAALTFARPWRLISLTTLLVAVLKSSQLSSVLLAAMSAADYQKDGNRPG